MPKFTDKAPSAVDLKKKARYWTAVGYPENMLDSWEEDIGDILEYPYAYCKHYRGLDTDGDSRKKHVHIMIAFPNTTTCSAALELFRELNAEGKNAFPNAFIVHSVRQMYDYLIHNTEECRKKGKEPYDPAERITGNNFDIGFYEQLSGAEKEEIANELIDLILDNQYSNFANFVADVRTNLDQQYLTVIMEKSGFFEKLTKGNFQNIQFEQLYKNHR